jgi:hypothetical protein
MSVKEKVGAGQRDLVERNVVGIAAVVVVAAAAVVDMVDGHDGHDARSGHDDLDDRTAVDVAGAGTAGGDDSPSEGD